MGRLIRSATDASLSVGLALLLALSPFAAHADPASETKAKALYKDGMKAYDVGDFSAALELYSDAYKLAPLPGFLFNIAQCHRQLSNFEQAAFFYGRFVDTSKARAPNVELANQLRAEMTAKQAEKVSAEQKQQAEDAKRAEEMKRMTDVPMAPPPLVPSPAVEGPPVVVAPAVVPEEHAYNKWWFWTLIAVGVAGAAGITAGAIVAGRPARAQPTTQDPIGMPH